MRCAPYRTKRKVSKLALLLHGKADLADLRGHSRLLQRLEVGNEEVGSAKLAVLVLVYVDHAVAEPVHTYAIVLGVVEEEMD